MQWNSKAWHQLLVSTSCFGWRRPLACRAGLLACWGWPFGSRGWPCPSTGVCAASFTWDMTRSFRAGAWRPSRGLGGACWTSSKLCCTPPCTSCCCWLFTCSSTSTTWKVNKQAHYCRSRTKTLASFEIFISCTSLSCSSCYRPCTPVSCPTPGGGSHTLSCYRPGCWCCCNCLGFLGFLLGFFFVLDLLLPPSLLWVSKQFSASQFTSWWINDINWWNQL